MTLPFLVSFHQLQQLASFLSERRTNSRHVTSSNPSPELFHSQKHGPVTIMDGWRLGRGAVAPVDLSIIYATGQVPFQDLPHV